jgi:GT2 family glycosyltransferase
VELKVTHESDTSTPLGAVTRLLAVIVLYKVLPSESTSLNTLVIAAKQLLRTDLKLGILVYDNTPGGQAIDVLSEEIRYEAAPRNLGLAHAYNRALEIAQTEGYDWLLTLDQDTILPPDFLVRIGELASRFSLSTTVGAIVPHVIGDGRNLSPFRFRGGVLPYWFPAGYVGVPRQAVYAVNSASILRVSALQQIGGYDPIFPLDLSDINLFHRLYRSGRRVFVAGDVLVHHELALLNKHQRMSLDRYKAGLMDECAFWDTNMNQLARLERISRLVGRVCRDFFNPAELGFRNITLSELKRRIVVPRAQRVAEWTIWSKKRSAFFSKN